MAPASPRSPLERLIADLHASDPLRRDAAVARLRVLGARAVPRLAAIIESESATAPRALALAALEGTQDPRVMELALGCLDSADGETIIAALGVLRGWVTVESGTRVLEAVTAIAVDPSRDARIRLAAVEALSDLPAHLVEPIRAQAPPPESAGPALDDPAAAREWVEAHAGKATLSSLHDAVKAFREHESATASPRAREEWTRARGAVHAALAARGSRVAFYDVKEAIEAAHDPLPPGFLEAMRALGDASGLEPLARAWAAAPRGSQWREQVAETAREIVRRSKLTARNAVLKEIRANWAGFV